MPFVQKYIGYIIAGAVSLGVFGILLWMLISAKVEVGQLEINNEALVNNQETQQVLIENYNKQIEVASLANIKLSKELSINKEETIQQQKVFISHNLGSLLDKKPTRIIKLSNAKTKQIFDNFSKFTKDFENYEGEEDE